MFKSKSQIVALVVFVAFLVWTTFLCQDYNYITFFKPLLAVGPGIQVLTDLTIAMSLILIWMYFDCKKTGRRYWIYFTITFIFGSFGPLLYFILQKPEDTSSR